MHKILSTIAFGIMFGFSFSAAHADMPMPPFYASVMKMKPEGKLGQVISKEQITTTVKGAQAWRIAYISSDAAGRKTISTGSLIAPLGKAPVEGRPVIAWAHGTTGTAQNCGPSQVFDPTAPLNQYFLVGGTSWTDYGIPSVNTFISKGYVVVATDYQGLGGGGKHQYNMPATNSLDLINSARAASSLKETGANNKVVFIGWSQGAGAVAAATTNPAYFNQKGTAADNLQLIGSVAMAPGDVAALVPKPTDEASAKKVMDAVVSNFTKNVFDFAHYAMTMWGLEAANPNLKLRDIFTEDGAKAVNDIVSNKCVHVAASTFGYAYGDNYKSLMRDQRNNNLAWASALVDGSLRPAKPIAPMVIYWGTKDVVVVPVMNQIYQEQVCKLGGNIERVQLPGEQTHFSTPPTSEQFYLPWIQDRMAGKPFANGCPKS
jgi:pimeloyl-ACP methyl ester carboxylesterase